MNEDVWNSGECDKFFRKSMEQWKLSLTSNGKDLGEVDAKRGIFQGDSLSPLLFVLCMIPLSLVLRKVNVCYEWGKIQAESSAIHG